MISLMEYADKIVSEGKQGEAKILCSIIQEYRCDDYDPSPNHRSWEFQKILDLLPQKDGQMIHERMEDKYCLFTGGLPLQQFGCDWYGGRLHPSEVQEHRRRIYWKFPSDNSFLSLWVLCKRLLTIFEADGGNIPMNPDVLWEKFSQIVIKTVQHLF